MSEAQQKIEQESNEPEKVDETMTSETETESPPLQNSTDETKPAENKGGRVAAIIAFIALIIAVGALAAGYQAWMHIGEQQTNLDNRINTTEKNFAAIESGSASSRSIAQTVQSTNQLLQTRMDSMESKLGTLEGKITTSVDSLDQKFSSSIGKLEQSDSAIGESLNKLNDALRASKENNLLVAEARYLINLANHQAQLNHNPAAAAAALSAANQRLSDAADPSLLTARQTLTDNIIALRNIAALDISGIALTLSQLEKSIDGLPLKSKKPAAAPKAEASEEEASAASAVANKIWGDIKGLVSISRNSDSTSVALLPPGQRFFLVQNLRLKLEAARLALLQRDTVVFHDSLNTVKQWLETYFDTSATSSANLLSTIEPYQSLELVPALPDISKSLKALDEWSSKQNNAAISEPAAEEVSAS